MQAVEVILLEKIPSIEEANYFSRNDRKEKFI